MDCLCQTIPRDNVTPEYFSEGLKNRYGQLSGYNIMLEDAEKPHALGTHEIVALRPSVELYA